MVNLAILPLHTFVWLIRSSSCNCRHLISQSVLPYATAGILLVNPFFLMQMQASYWSIHSSSCDCRHLIGWFVSATGPIIWWLVVSVKQRIITSRRHKSINQMPVRGRKGWPIRCPHLQLQAFYWSIHSSSCVWLVGLFFVCLFFFATVSVWFVDLLFLLWLQSVIGCGSSDWMTCPLIITKDVPREPALILTYKRSLPLCKNYHNHSLYDIVFSVKLYIVEYNIFIIGCFFEQKTKTVLSLFPFALSPLLSLLWHLFFKAMVFFQRE